jgi:hypothetical protein
MILRKVTAPKTSTDEELVNICRKEFNFSGGIIQAGESTESPHPTSPPSNTLAVVVNISSDGGSLKVYRTSDNRWGNDFIDKVGTEDCERGTKLVIIEWEPTWWYRSLSAIETRYVVRNED